MDIKDSTSEGSMGSLEPSSIQMFANTSSLHGIRHIFVYGPVTIRRLLWTMAFVGSLGLLLVESSDRVAFYFSYQHVTKVDEVVANSLVFPAVTICNLNEFRFSRLTTNDLYHAGELLALLDVNLQIPEPHLADPAVLAALQEKANFKQYKPKIFNMQEFLGRVGHDLKDMLLYCKFKGQECSQKDFKTVHPERLLLLAGAATPPPAAHASTSRQPISSLPSEGSAIPQLEVHNEGEEEGGVAGVSGSVLPLQCVWEELFSSNVMFALG
ncbi:acid-sensing ion channel 2-like [Malaclemys terrapin pileata]|uniref:acid-sensing ion channel 2-like n=1 Tax=Malaclemys terrapin pileata TaxID=2991368 RepID=UPI0023A84A63|nr:acid-sensing ion channel 2-like [Malaclemys terrapin pileata]